MPEQRWKAYAVAGGVFLLDRLSKRLVEAHVSFSDTYRVIPGFFDLVRSTNRGVAFGFLNDTSGNWSTAVLSLFSMAAVVLVSALLWNPRRLDNRSLWGFALVLGGAAGNLFDRLAAGRVTDFLLFYIGQYQWPTFNIADSALVIGSGLLVLDLLRPGRQAANVP